MMDDVLNGCVALVTGGSTGIGYACAEAMARAGCKVVITARTQADGIEAEKTLRDQGYDVLFLQQDVSREDDWLRVLHDLEAQYGRLDFLINNAGISALSPIDETTAESLCTIIGVNLIGAYYGLVHGIPLIL